MSAISPIRAASSLPITQVMRVSGQWACSVRITGRVWQMSPMADRRRTQISFGGVGRTTDMAIEWHSKRTSDGQYLLHETGSTAGASPEWFEPAHWQALGAVTGQAPGRGQTLFLDTEAGPLVLRHYLRGGLMARLSRDRYLWLRAERTRSVRELRLMAALFDQGLPVPRPVAARAWRHGLTGSADILLRFLPGTRTLADLLSEAPLASGTWAQVGACIARFHQAGLDHADLNARNILIHPEQGVYLIDFDNSRLRPPAQTWQSANLERLLRSLNKFHGLVPGFHFGQRDWTTLRAGYSGR